MGESKMRFVKIPICNYEFNDPIKVVDFDLDKVTYYHDHVPYAEHPGMNQTIVLANEKTIIVNLPYGEFDVLMKRPLNPDQIQSVLNWMSEWDQLRDGIIPIRFKEDFSR